MSKQELNSMYPDSVYQGLDDKFRTSSKSGEASFKALERQHQKTIAYLHAAQRGEIEIDGLSGKKINGAIRWERKQLRWARKDAIRRGDIPPYPEVEQMRKMDYIHAIEKTNGHLNGNGHNGHEKENLADYQTTTSAAGEPIPVGSLR